jgi:cytochrome c oxidase cbb3-type subunit 3
MKRILELVTLAAAVGGLVFFCIAPSIEAASGTAAQPAAPALHAGPAAGRPVNQDAKKEAAGAQVYADNCAICHGDHREGNLPAFPPLVGVQHHMTDAQITDLVQKGKNRMPGNPALKGDDLKELLAFLNTADVAAAVPEAVATSAAKPSDEAAAGGALFQQNCAFCHGRDTMGGESGPDLTRSKLALADVNGDKIGEVVRNGRSNGDKKMPAFNFSPAEVQSLAAFIHAQQKMAEGKPGGRRGVDVADLQTGNVEAGKQYFNGAGGCSSCHSPTGDLAGIATRYEGLKLEERMLYPEGVKNKVVVTLPSGAKIAGTVAYQDEFTIGLRDADGVYHSWLTKNVKFKVDAPVEAHVALFPRYTDADIHNLMAYLQTLR